METTNSSSWSELPMDILRSVLERLSFVDFQRTKLVCPNWYLCSKQMLPQKPKSPWLILFPDNDVCALYNPEEARVYKTTRDFSNIRFLANSGNWFLVLDSKSNLCIINVFNEKKIDLPPLDSLKGNKYNLERFSDKKFIEVELRYATRFIQSTKNLRGLLWVDKKKEEYVVVWYFTTDYNHMDKYRIKYIAFCKNGEDHYREIPTRCCYAMVLCGPGNSLYVSVSSLLIRKLDFSGQKGSKDVSYTDIVLPKRPQRPSRYIFVSRFSENFAVTISGEVLVVQSFFFALTSNRRFRLYKKDPKYLNLNDVDNPNPAVEVDSLGDETLLLDLGITVPADYTLGIEPNSIYFTAHDCVYDKKISTLDICVFNLATKTVKRFPGVSNLKLQDAQWFLTS